MNPERRIDAPEPIVLYSGEFVEGLRANRDRLRDLAELAVTALLPVLPLEGSWGNYRVSEHIDPTIRALPEEWAEAAHAIAELCAALECS